MQPEGTNPRLLTVREVARKLRVSRRTVYGWIASGKLRAIRPSERTTRVPAEALEGLVVRRPDLSSVLWDVDPGSVDEERHSRFLVERILEEGNDEQVAWLLRRYPRWRIAEVARTSRRLSRRSAAAWSVLLGRGA